ncbi:MAG: hypothetical protein NVS4B7_10700 [Ktedonobacteraceae bacterium]
MSQQEFFQEPQFQEQQPLEDEEIQYSQPYYWSTRPNAPKEEPASRYDEPMIGSNYQSGYVAQDAMAHPYQQSAATSDKNEGSRTQSRSFQGQKGHSQSQQQQFSPDADAFEQQYRPHAAYNAPQWNVPFWARPQRQKRHWSRVILFLIIGILLIRPLLILLAILGMLALTLIIPFALVLFVGLPFILFRAVKGRPFPRRRWRYTSYWRR